MTDVYGSYEKIERRSRLFQVGVEALQKGGWTVERVQGSGKASVRKITKAGKSQLVSIRTTQDTWIAFPRTKDDKDWVTLSEVDSVVAVSLDDARDPKFVKVHMVDGREMLDRFNRAYAARVKAGHRIPAGRGVWVSLYIKESNHPRYVGAGAGLKYPPIATVPLDPKARLEVEEKAASGDDEAPLTIAEAKRRLALSLGVNPGSIKITVEA
jgi:hypothetical protein